MADFDYDKLDQAITKFMKAMGASDDDIDAAKVDSIDKARQTTAQRQPKSRTVGHSEKHVASAPSVKAEAIAPKKQIETISDIAPARKRKPTKMIGGKVTGNLSPENTLTIKQKRALAARTIKPGKGHYLDMVAPSSDAANRHKPNLVGEPNTADKHNLAQPTPVNPAVDFVSAADTDKSYVSPFLPGATGKKRPLGGVTSEKATRREKPTLPYHSVRHATNHQSEDVAATDNNVSRKPTEVWSETRKHESAKRRSGVMAALLKVGLFLLVVIVGGLIGVICFYFFG